MFEYRSFSQQQKKLYYCNDWTTEEKIEQLLNSKDNEELKSLFNNCDSSIKINFDKIFDSVCRKNNLELVKYLCEEKNVDPKSLNSSSLGVLDATVTLGYLELTKYLVVEKGLNCRHAIFNAHQHNHKEILLLLIEHCEKIDDNTISILIHSEDIETIKSLADNDHLDDCPNLNKFIRETATKGNYQILTVLQKVKERKEEKEKQYKDEALSLAKKQGDKELIAILEGLKITNEIPTRNIHNSFVFDMPPLHHTYDVDSDLDI